MAAPSAASKAVGKVNIGTSGKVFFGSLCVGTFGLGCWQMERLLMKWDAIEDREAQLKLDPVRYGSMQLNQLVGDDQLSQSQTQPYRQRLLRGRFRHDKEVLVGPRGAPPGVQMPVSGLSAKKNPKKTTAAGGMQPGPQGFYVLTPMEISFEHDAAATNNGSGATPSTVWINRGWIPRTVVPGADRTHYKNDPVQKARMDHLLKQPVGWNRPRGMLDVKAVLSKAEKPRFITPEHDYSKRPLQLFWMDGLALKAIAAEMYTPEDLASNSETAMVVQVVDDGDSNENSEGPLLYPLQPPVSSISNFKTTPATHVGYAATWFGLSGAGLYMTRKLITKGRF